MKVLKDVILEDILVPALVSLIVSGILVPIAISSLSPERDIRNIINNEANLAKEGKIEDIISLYDDNAFIMDARAGLIWEGKEKIIDRYKALPKFNYLEHSAIEITLSSDREYARAIADTIGEYNMNESNIEISSNRGERWSFKKVDGKWKITGFSYNLP